MKLAGTIVSANLVYPGVIEFTDKIEAVEAFPGAPKRYILPGFLDLHLHGGGGADCMDGEEATRQMARFHAVHGTTALLATTVTAPLAEIEGALRGINAVMQNPATGEARILGVHLEGPFISTQKLGAQPPYAILPDIEIVQHLMSLAPIKVVTLAPELPGASELIRFLVQRQVRVQIGHTTASYAQAKEGFVAGAQGFTHFYNAMTGLHHREPGVVGLGLEQGEWAEVILDGLHVHPAAAKALWKSIPGTYAVSDAVEAAGMPGGEYHLGRHKVYKRGNGVFLADGTLAGSALTMHQTVRNLREWGYSFDDVVEATSSRPRRYLGVEEGGLEAGASADMVVLGEHLEIEEVYIQGQKIR